MPTYRPAGQRFHFPVAIRELEPFKTADGREKENSQEHEFRGAKLVTATQGWVAGDERIMEVYESESGFLLKVENCGEYFITPRGEEVGKQEGPKELSQLHREILLGPVIVFALALRNVWSLHSSAATYKETLFAFLGESGMGKSTLSAYLSKQAGWNLAADDILPIQEENGLQALPRFPQLKLKVEEQPGIRLPEKLPLKTICVLESVKANAKPELRKMNAAQAVQAFLRHIAGTRMFNTELLAKHLQFSTQAAAQVTAYSLKYPHRREALPMIKEILEQC